jgi:hypothetical protein
MIGSLRTRLPPGLRVGDHGAHLVPVTQILGCGIGRYAGHADCVRQRVPHGCTLLAVGAELGPQLHDQGVVAEEAALYEHMRHGGGRTLADRVGVEWRIRGDLATAFRVGYARDGVYQRLALAVDGGLQTPLGPRVDQPVDGFLDLRLNVAHDRFPS